jgi:hypothetical protein
VGRPKPPKPWNSSAIVAKDAPGFRATGEGKNIEFMYTIENTTAADYRIETYSDLKVMIRAQNGGYSTPFPKEIYSLDLPVFVPGKQKGTLNLTLIGARVPERKAMESDDEYHEKLRQFCDQEIGGLAAFVLFDDSNRYQINLPRWLDEKPKNP